MLASNPFRRSVGEAQSSSREAVLRCEALQLLPSFLDLPEDPKRPIMEAVGAIVVSFPLTSRERSGSTQHTAYVSQLVAIFDALCGATNNAHNVTALLDVSPRPPQIATNRCPGACPITSPLGVGYPPPWVWATRLLECGLPASLSESIHLLEDGYPPPWVWAYTTSK